jgi:hypothetical protein
MRAKNAWINLYHIPARPGMSNDNFKLKILIGSIVTELERKNRRSIQEWAVG